MSSNHASEENVESPSTYGKEALRRIQEERKEEERKKGRAKIATSCPIYTMEAK